MLPESHRAVESALAHKGLIRFLSALRVFC
jgi:hypothetical protein